MEHLRDTGKIFDYYDEEEKNNLLAHKEDWFLF
jgi:hypothetical protein